MHMFALFIKDKFCRGNHLCQLVCHKANEIMGEFTSILCETSWSGLFLKIPTAIADEFMADAPAMIFDIFAHHCASYYRRVVVPLHRYPLQIFILHRLTT